MINEIAKIIISVSIVIVFLIIGRNIGAMYLLYRERFYSTKARLDYGWWSLWGFRVGLILLALYLFFQKTFVSQQWTVSSWTDIVVAILIALVMVTLFGMLVGHIALMFHKIYDKRYFRKGMATTAKAGGKAKRRIQKSKIIEGFKTGDISIAKIVIFAVMGYILIYWILEKFISSVF